MCNVLILQVNTLLKLYSKYLYNLSLTVMSLERLAPDMKTKRYSNNVNKILSANIPLLQECAFIQHKAELGKYLAELKEKEEKEFKKLKVSKDKTKS